MILNYVWKSDIDTSFATCDSSIPIAAMLKRCRWMAHHMPTRQWWTAGKWDDSYKEKNKSGTFYRETSTGSMEDKWFILFERYIRSESILLSVIFLLFYYIYIYMIIEEERIFINFLPRLRVIKLRIFPDIDKVRNYFCNRRGSNYREILILKSTLNKQLWWNW